MALGDDLAMEEAHPEHPHRMSALYQYHNAPEVAPAHGLEYDDSNYPHSDKFPVIHSTPIFGENGWTNRAFAQDSGKPPLILFGMKLRTFFLVFLILVVVVVGAAVGGVVGNTSIKNNSAMVGSSPANGTITNSTSTTPTPATPSVYLAPTPTFTPISDCPAANNTIFTSQHFTGSNNQSNAQMNFTRYCDFSSSSLMQSNTLSSSFAYSFEDCIESCAALNFYGNNGACKIASFSANATRPTNCWVGSQNSSLSDLTAQSGTDIALLHSP